PVDAPLAGQTVLEAGRRIQAPPTAHLLGLLGAEVVRIEPPGGDPLRGMPPTCSGVPARWLALHPGRKAVEADIELAAEREPPRSAWTTRTCPPPTPRSSTRTPADGPTGCPGLRWAPTSWCRPAPEWGRRCGPPTSRPCRP